MTGARLFAASRLGLRALGVLITGIALVGCKGSPDEPQPAAPSPTAPPGAAAPAPYAYVGSERCRACHQRQFDAWRGSQHQAALQVPTPETVHGDFTVGAVSSAHEATRVQRDGAQYTLTTLGQTYAVKYTIGVRPLEQYLLDVGQGRLQASTLAYDTRPAAEGGARWYQLQPRARTQPGDELHWTAAAYNWSSACADCHSTHLQKGYDRAHDRYDTRFSELSVGCEACHGPGSEHVAKAARGAAVEDPGLLRRFATPDERHWRFVQDRPIAILASGAPVTQELDACAACHSHRADLGGDSLSFHDRYRLDLLNDDLYHPDGQQKEETFELGSFEQSKMFAAGVVCSDCHEPHSGSLRRPGNALCGGCHDAGRYDRTSHHLHDPGTTPARCVTCHMPTHTFMEIDARREHRFAVPRPDLTLALDVPNPCTSACHAERRRGPKPAKAAATWASRVIREHFGPEREPSFAPALAAGRRLASDGAQQLLGVATEERFPAIARASALTELGRYPELRTSDVGALARDPNPLVRRAFAELMGNRATEERRARLLPLLTDSVRSVRLEAARHLIDVPEPAPPERDALARVLPELRRSLEHNADRAGALLELARLELATTLDASAGASKAEALFRRAEAQEPSFAAAYLNHADFLREQGREAEALATLERGLGTSRDRAPLEHALGLAEVRRGNPAKGREHLRRAFALAPESGQLGYVYAVALADAGKLRDATLVLEQLHRATPGDLATLELLRNYVQRLGDTARAAELSRELAALRSAAR